MLPTLGQSGHLGDVKIIESTSLVEPGTPYEVPRTWKERLFSRPWQPLKKTKTVTPMVPMEKVMRLDNHTMVMHPEIAARLKHQIASSKDYP